MLGFPLQQIEHEDVIERVSVISDGGRGGGCWVGQRADVNILLISITNRAHTHTPASQGEPPFDMN